MTNFDLPSEINFEDVNVAEKFCPIDMFMGLCPSNWVSFIVKREFGSSLKTSEVIETPFEQNESTIHRT